jgi:HK97 family phage major capsid protein
VSDYRTIPLDSLTVTVCACGCGRQVVQRAGAPGPEPQYFDAACRQRAFRQRQMAKASIRRTHQQEIDELVNWRPGDPMPAHAARREDDPTADPMVVEKSFVDWLRGDLSREDYASKASLVEDATGQVLVPIDIAADVLQVARRGVVRSLTVPRPTTRAKQRQSLLTAAATGWGRLETGTVATDANVVPAANPRDIEVWDLVTLCSIGLDELSDTPAAAYPTIVDVIGNAIRETEDDAFAAGTGTSQPFGIAQAVTDGRITQAITAASPPTVANLRALVWDPPAWARANAVWLMSTDAAEAVAGLLDGTTNPIWPKPGLPRAADGGGLFGYDAYELPGLPAMTGTNAPSIIFGDVAAGYRIVDRMQLTIQRLTEQYAAVGKVGLLVKHRVGGDVVRPAAFAAYRL